MIRLASIRTGPAPDLGPADAVACGSPGAMAWIRGEVIDITVDSDAVKGGAISLDFPPNRARYVTVTLTGSLATRFANRWRRQMRRDRDRRRRNRLRRALHRRKVLTLPGPETLTVVFTAP